MVDSKMFSLIHCVGIKILNISNYTFYFTLFLKICNFIGDWINVYFWRLYLLCCSLNLLLCWSSFFYTCLEYKSVSTAHCNNNVTFLICENCLDNCILFNPRWHFWFFLFKTSLALQDSSCLPVTMLFPVYLLNTKPGMVNQFISFFSSEFPPRNSHSNKHQSHNKM